MIWKKILIILMFIIILGYQGIHLENAHKWIGIVARYVVYMLIIKGSREACALGYSILQAQKTFNIEEIIKHSKKYALIFVASIAILLYNKQRILDEDFLLWFIAYLVTKYPEVEANLVTINYGVGMACSYFEGYLVHVIPSDGAKFVGFEENMDIYAAKQGIVFPVKRLFIIITKSMYCPPDLKHFNKANRDDLSYLEACQSLEEIEKDVAGVKNRIYRNSAYKIYRPDKPPVYLSAECATPLHTLHRVLQKTAIYEDLAKVNVLEVVSDFCRTLSSIISKSPECRDKCELVYYDDTDPKANLASILLDKIRDLEPNFENLKNE
ncbi:stimulator of interferon genes protein isoform X2 [Papilio machaon]|uniref:stimulator of interferon genes protein isoform X2 n=1 Tax=Papilio machaon TaxID=76193 RepID=UPI001E663CF0|nr:stimulator of interferon genes protein isoform X2 [Papilio machaon]